MAVSFVTGRIETFLQSTGLTYYQCIGCGDSCLILNDSAYDEGFYVPDTIAYQKRYYGLCIPSPVGLTVTWDGFGTIGNRWIILADSATLLDTGCTAGSGSAPITIPAGTKEVVYTVGATCFGSGLDIWSINVSC